MRRLAALGALLACAAALAACGLGAGESVSGVQLTVTRDFGTRALGQREAAEVPGGETVMRFLTRNFTVDHALRRRVRAVDQRGWAEASNAAGRWTGSTT